MPGRRHAVNIERALSRDMAHCLWRAFNGMQVQNKDGEGLTKKQERTLAWFLERFR